MLDRLLPASFLAAIGAYFWRRNSSAPSQGQGATQTPPVSVAKPSAAYVLPKPLPTNIPLSRDQVHLLAERMIITFSFACSARDLVATAYVESSFRPWVTRQEKRTDGSVWDTSYGLMQTLLGTARDMYQRGYKGAGEPTAAMLLKPEVSMYFGAAYKDWLVRSYKGKSPEWYVRAYNGGPGWEKTQAGPANTAVYYSRIMKALRSLYGGA